MLKVTMIVAIMLTTIVCCMGQTFQYSRGWTNGKRSDSHPGASNEAVNDSDWEKKLEKCLYTLQRITQIPYLRNVLMVPSRKYNPHHRILSDDDVFGTDSMETRLKRHANGITV